MVYLYEEQCVYPVDSLQTSLGNNHGSAEQKWDYHMSTSEDTGPTSRQNISLYFKILDTVQNIHVDKWIPMFLYDDLLPTQFEGNPQ